MPHSYLVDLILVARLLPRRKLGLLHWRRSPTYKALLSNDDFSTNPDRGRRQECVEQPFSFALVFHLVSQAVLFAAILLAALPCDAQPGGENHSKLNQRRQQMLERFQNMRQRGSDKTPSVRVPMTWINSIPTDGLPPGNYARRIESSGMSRWYEIHVPPGYKAGSATPAVLLFHGGGGNPDQQRYDARIDEVSDKHGFIALIPAGTGPLSDERLLTWNCEICCGFALKRRIDDVGFVKDLLNDAKQFLSIDSNRVFATGLSNGALMSYMVASKLPDEIAAIAPVAAIMPPANGAAGKPIPIMHFHGLLDRNAPYNGGTGENSIAHTNFPSVKSSLAKWLKNNRCLAKPTSTRRQGHALVTTYSPSQTGAEFILCTLEDGGHTWPGGRVIPSTEKVLHLGPVNHDVFATEMMWQFFTEHPLTKKDP